MKQFWAFLAIVLTFTLTMEAAHAKRMGGGKSFGRTHQTAPAQPSRSTMDAPAQQKQQAASNAGKKGMMGGLLGGLLAGGLLAALFAGGAFEGLQLMDILMIAALAFVIFKLIKMLRQGGAPVQRQQPAYAGAGQPQSQPDFGMRRETPLPQSSSVSAGVAVPFNLPMGFDSPAFIEGAKEHYRVLQEAWNQNNLAKIQEYVTPELFAELQAERASLPAQQHTEVLSVNAELVRADQVFGNAEVSIQFTGQYRDTVEGVNEAFTDIWHLERNYAKNDAPWFITGIESR